jgi:predicted tellurium resistance membrane protein TerC
MIDLLTDPQAWLSLAILTLMEIVLGIDNIVFISILTGRLPRERQVAARRLGLAGALLTRLALLLTLNWISHLESTLFTLVRPW